MKMVFGDSLGYMVVDKDTREPIYASDPEDWDVDEFICALADHGMIKNSDSIIAGRDLCGLTNFRDDREGAQEYLGVDIEMCAYNSDDKVWEASDGAMYPGTE